MRRFTLSLIILNLVVNMLHGAAHQVLHIGLSQTQLIFVIVVISAAPLVAGALLLKRHDQSGALLFTAAMLGSLIFGVWNHFIVISPDHVSMVQTMPQKIWTNTFMITSVLLAIIETVGTIAGIKLFLQNRTGVWI